MKTFAHILLLFLVLGFNDQIVAQKLFPAPEKFSVKELKQDFIKLRHRLEKYHPNLYLYVSPKQFSSALDSLYESIDHPMTAREFYLHVIPVQQLIKDGHTWILPGKIYRKDIYYEKRIPFHAITVQNQLRLRFNLSRDSSLTAGTEILSINGQEAHALVEELKALLPRDGDNKSMPETVFNYWFRVVYGYQYGHPDKYVLELKNNEDSVYKKTIDALPEDSSIYYGHHRYFKHSKGNSNYKPISFDKLDSTTAFLRVNSFSNATLRRYKQKFKKVIANFFDTIQSQNPETLIIDLRENQGGQLTNGSFLLSYLFDEEINIIQDANVPIQQKKYPEKKRRRTKNIILKTINSSRRKSNYHFGGKVIVLADGLSFSCTGLVCSALEKHERAIFVGKEVGGNAKIISGVGHDTKLPNTKVVLKLPLTRYTTDSIKNNLGHGVKPDFQSSKSINDILRGKDPALQKAREIGSSEKTPSL